MYEHEDLSNPNRYRILIQIKKNRRLKRKASYLTSDFEFTEDIKQAKTFSNLQDAEQVLPKIMKITTGTTRPRIVIKYLVPENKSITKWTVK